LIQWSALTFRSAMFDKVPKQEFWAGVVAALLIGGAVAASITRYAVHQYALRQLISSMHPAEDDPLSRTGSLKSQ
jgi:hypothetical protein